ncbi:MAG: nucleotide exchange factor GrpE [Deltaproteobacteria bacterium]|nr:MAG: nucleotide exchange factor GrpE [Deltaproteobacteria bacterium]
MADRDKETSSVAPAPDGELESAGGETAAGPADTVPEGTDETTELKVRLAYLAAEFDNFRKRAAREREAQAAFGNERLLGAVLPFLDNLERAMGQVGASTEAVLSGVRMTYDQFLAELRKFGLEPFSSEGEPFDPGRHEAIARVPLAGKADGTVLSETRKGYMLNGRLLRPAQVAVAVTPPTDGQGGESDGLEN